MQTIKPRAIFCESTGEWIVHGLGIVRIRTCIQQALQAWHQRVLQSQTLK
jgi:hypothetical protein